jgi:hypothetical protein
MEPTHLVPGKKRIVDPAPQWTALGDRQLAEPAPLRRKPGGLGAVGGGGCDDGLGPWMSATDGGVVVLSPGWGGGGGGVLPAVEKLHAPRATKKTKGKKASPATAVTSLPAKPAKSQSNKFQAPRRRSEQEVEEDDSSDDELLDADPKEGDPLREGNDPRGRNRRPVELDTDGEFICPYDAKPLRVAFWCKHGPGGWWHLCTGFGKKGSNKSCAYRVKIRDRVPTDPDAGHGYDRETFLGVLSRGLADDKMYPQYKPRRGDA